MKKTLMRMGVGVLRIIYAPFRLLKVKKNRITFMSRQSEGASIDVKMLADRIRAEHPEADLRVMVKMLKPTVGGMAGYCLHMIAQMHALATSRVVVLDGYCITACVLPHKPETRVIQMWHSLAAIKKFGYQSLDTPAGHSSEVAEIMCMHRNYDCIICPSEATGRLFCRAMNTDEDKMAVLGLPRIDVISRHDTQAAARIREEYGIREDKKILLYVPTFRKGEKVRVRELAEALDRSRYELVVKLHPVYKEEGDVPEDVISDDRYSSYEWLNACDGVITDYSAMGIEGALAGRPVYFYLYDQEEYEKNVGLNINPMTELPGASAVTAAEMAEIIEGEYDFGALREFRDRYVTADRDNCTERLADFIWKKSRNS